MWKKQKKKHCNKNYHYLLDVLSESNREPTNQTLFSLEVLPPWCSFYLPPELWSPWSFSDLCLATCRPTTDHSVTIRALPDVDIPLHNWVLGGLVNSRWSSNQYWCQTFLLLWMEASGIHHIKKNSLRALPPSIPRADCTIRYSMASQAKYNKTNSNFTI